ncbi:hypothetical protein A2U01_0099832, partial [Trifolium medium]|nr:hypothetical protein [Trifolium medium]
LSYCRFGAGSVILGGETSSGDDFKVGGLKLSYAEKSVTEFAYASGTIG